MSGRVPRRELVEEQGFAPGALAVEQCGLPAQFPRDGQGPPRLGQGGADHEDAAGRGEERPGLGEEAAVQPPSRIEHRMVERRSHRAFEIRRVEENQVESLFVCSAGFSPYICGGSGDSTDTA